MTPTRSEINLQKDVLYAEFLSSVPYREASSAEFANNPDFDTYLAVRGAAQAIYIHAIEAGGNPENQKWEMTRIASIMEISKPSVNLGAFSEVIGGLCEQGGEERANGLSSADLDDGTPGAVKTNYTIVGLGEVLADPTDYLEAALDEIDHRAGASDAQKNIGPENYATAMKIFADKYLVSAAKYRTSAENSIDVTKLQKVARDALDGFLNTLKFDTPNFIEMTNLFCAIRALPKGTFNADQSREIILQSLARLPDFDDDRVSGNGTLRIMMDAIANLDLSETGQASANLINLAMRKGLTVSTSRDYIGMLRAIANLPATKSADRTMKTFMERRNDVEQSVAQGELDAINELLYTIVSCVVTEPEVSQAIKTLSLTIVEKAVENYNRLARSGQMFSTLEAAQHQELINNIVKNYRRI